MIYGALRVDSEKGIFSHMAIWGWIGDNVEPVGPKLGTEGPWEKTANLPLAGPAWLLHYFLPGMEASVSLTPLFG